MNTSMNTRGLFGSVLLIAALVPGCARFSTVQVDRSVVVDQIGGTNRTTTRVIETRAGAYTLWASESALANWSAAQTDKSQTAKVGTISQKSDVINSNAAPVIEAVAKGVVNGLKGGGL